MNKLNRTRTILNAYLPPLLWAGFIYFLSHQSRLPGADSPLIDFIFKHSAHIFMYAVLHSLIWRSLKLTHHQSAKIWYLPIILSFVYALSDEVHQSLVPGRTPTMMDIGFDSLGILISHYLTHR